MPEERGELRLDIWLWAARFFKTRGLARAAIEAGRVELDGARCKPSRAVRVGDRMQVNRGHERLELDVLALAWRRGPASEAQWLYRETEASREAAEVLREERRLSGAALDHPAHRPDKQARRQLRKIKGLR
ncbi:MAG: S4 domain-containing protein [Rhodanobacter sp.]|jgi:ribosome-associated heat shock protein Hsp15